MQDSQGQVANLSVIMNTATSLKADSLAFDLLPKATVLLTHPNKALRQAASTFFDGFLSMDQNASGDRSVSDRLKTSLLEMFRFEFSMISLLTNSIRHHSNP
jgi:hypothetical protein